MRLLKDLGKNSLVQFQQLVKSVKIRENHARRVLECVDPLSFSGVGLRRTDHDSGRLRNAAHISPPKKNPN